MPLALIGVMHQYLIASFILDNLGTFAVISDSGRYFEISFSVSPGHIENDPFLIAWSRVRLIGQKRISR